MQPSAPFDSPATPGRTRQALRSHPQPAAALQPDELAATLQLAEVAAAIFDARQRLRFANDALWDLVWPEGRQRSAPSLAELAQALRAQLADPAALPDLTQAPHDGAATALPALALRDGRWLRLRMQANGRGGLVLSARDVTLDVELDRQRSEFLSTAAHEMRNPMASILGFSELLMTRTLGTAQTQELAGIIHRQSTWMVGMVNELLDLARIESRRGKDFRIQALPLAAWLKDTVDTLGADAARLATELHDGAAMLHADPTKARHALVNVLSNALKYSPPGSTVRLRTSTQPRDQRPGLAIEVQDQGIGMDATAVDRIFERFYRADPGGPIPGTGLGMSLVQEIMNVHRGEVRVASQPGRGTTVTLWFSAAPAQATA